MEWVVGFFLLPWFMWFPRSLGRQVAEVWRGLETELELARKLEKKRVKEKRDDQLE